MRQPTREADVLRACLQVLDSVKHLGVCHLRLNTGAVKLGGRFLRFGSPGWPDIVAVLPPGGRLCGVECKAGRNRQTPAQRAVQAEIEAAGGLYVVAYSVDDLMQVLRREGVIR